MVTTFRHPYELLESFEDNNDPKTKITIKTTKRQLKKIETELKKKIDRMKLIFDASLKMYEIKEPETSRLSREFKETRRSICLSYLDSTFHTKYEDEFDDVKGSSDFWTLLHQIIGETNTEEEAKEARRNLKETSRRLDEEETFSRFYTRLEKLAETASKGCSTLKKHFLEEAFNANLTPDLHRYLLDQGKNKEIPSEIAKYLDEKKKYKKRVEIKAVSADNILLREEMTAISEQFSRLPELMKDILGSTLSTMVDDKLEQLRAEVSKVSPRTPIAQPERTHEQRQAVDAAMRFTRPREFQQDFNRPPRQQERHPDGTPKTCFGCGVKGHTKKNCRGTVICRHCNQRGHIKDICPMLSKNL